MDHALFIEIHRDQFDAVFDMISEAVAACPADLWDDRRFGRPIWQLAYHALDSLEFYMGKSPDSARVAPFGLEDTNLENEAGEAPSPRDFMQYLDSVRERCDAFLCGIAADDLKGPNAFLWTGRTTAHRLTYNIRHLQHHMGAINLILANSGSAKPIGWH